MVVSQWKAVTLNSTEKLVARGDASTPPYPSAFALRAEETDCWPELRSSIRRKAQVNLHEVV